MLTHHVPTSSSCEPACQSLLIKLKCMRTLEVFLSNDGQRCVRQKLTALILGVAVPEQLQLAQISAAPGTAVGGRNMENKAVEMPER